MRRGVIVALVLSLAGCWAGYAKRASVHAEVLSLTAAKLVSLIEAGRPPAVESMGEYVYPAKRAREFLQSYVSYREYESHRRLTELVTRYETLVRRVDAARAAQSDWSREIDWLRAEGAALHRLAAEIDGSLAARS
jgi:hypothetical protein